MSGLVLLLKDAVKKKRRFKKPILKNKWHKRLRLDRKIDGYVVSTFIRGVYEPRYVVTMTFGPKRGEV